MGQTMRGPAAQQHESLFAGTRSLLSDLPVMKEPSRKDEARRHRAGNWEGLVSRVADPKSKSALIRAAEEVFADRGIAGAKVEDIARSAGLSKGAFYLHFESKEAAL